MNSYFGKTFSRRDLLSMLAATAVAPAALRRSWGAEPSSAPDLLAIAAQFVKIAEGDRERHQLWGRIGGSDAEQAASALLASLLTPSCDELATEPFVFRAQRPLRWSLNVDGSETLASAMPAPFDARFPEETPSAPVTVISSDSDWSIAGGSWAFVEATWDGSPARTSVREKLLYRKAIDSGAVGLVFSLPMGPGVWRAIVPVDKPYAETDSAFPDGRRPIPCFCIDAKDGKRIVRGATEGIMLSSRIETDSREEWGGINVTGKLAGSGSTTVMLVAHLDSFFTGANDDASGLAALVGLARRISELPRERRPANFLFCGHSAHHDGASGMRAFRAGDAARFSSIAQAFQLEHVDAQRGAEGQRTDWPEPLNDRRFAYMGSKGWPEIEEALPKLVRETGLMTADPTVVQGCIGDLIAVCDALPRSFCLIQAPPYYHTDHDTLDKISGEGIAAAVDFHMRLLELTGVLS